MPRSMGSGSGRSFGGTHNNNSRGGTDSGHGPGMGHHGHSMGHHTPKMGHPGPDTNHRSGPPGGYHMPGHGPTPPPPRPVHCTWGRPGNHCRFCDVEHCPDRALVSISTCPYTRPGHHCKFCDKQCRFREHPFGF